MSGPLNAAHAAANHFGLKITAPGNMAQEELSTLVDTY